MAMRDFVYFLSREHGMSIKKVMALCDSLPVGRCAKCTLMPTACAHKQESLLGQERKTPTFGENPKQVSNSQTNVETTRSPSRVIAVP